MKLEARRLMYFTNNLPAMRHFYAEVLGLEEVEGDLIQFKAGPIMIALHNGKSEAGKRPPKLGFYVKNVAATREALIERGVKKMGKLGTSPELDRCDFRDPDGNMLGLSNRP